MTQSSYLVPEKAALAWLPALLLLAISKAHCQPQDVFVNLDYLEVCSNLEVDARRPPAIVALARLAGKTLVLL
jgi:hypothetical protein